MKNSYKKDELIKVISSVLEKHRDALSTDEVQAFEKTIEVLKRLDDSDPKDLGKILEPIAITLLKFFTNPHVMEKLMEWFNN